MITFSIENEEILGLISGAIEDFDDLSFEFGEIARSIAKYNRTNFILKGYGKYAPLSEAYAKWKRKHFPGQSILVRTGRLRDSVTDATRPSRDTILQVTKNSMAHGTKVPYGSYIQNGTKRMPARPYLFWDDPRLKIVERILTEGVNRRLIGGQK